MSVGDGANIAARASGVGGTCLVCGDELGAEPWWATDFPRGTHARCMDWSARAFPFSRHLLELRRLYRKLGRPDLAGARAAVVAAGRRLRALERAWPSGGHAAVVEASALIREARNALTAAGVDGALVARL
jgi:hypothetical protein